MPHPKGNLKLSGDVHLPDVESDLDLDLEEGENDLAELAKDRRQPRGAAERVRDAGVLSAGDEQPADARGLARPAGAQRTARSSAGSAALARSETGASPRDHKDPHGLAAAFREPVAHAADRAAATARTASPWTIWAVAFLAAAALVRALR